MIPRKRQAAPQAPARDFKPRKNGTPAVPATPPANMPRPAPAPQMQQPPMRGAAQSVGQPPQRAPQRAQGRFNPMRGPMGADMSRARQAAASMFMDRAPKPMQPSMPQQQQKQPQSMPQARSKGQMQAAAPSAMQQASQEAPKPQQTSQPQDFSPAQQAAIDIAGLGPMFAKSGEAPSPPPDSEQMEISGGEDDEAGGMFFSSLPTVSADVLGALPDTSMLADVAASQPPQTEQQKKAANAQLREASLQGKGKEYADDFISKFGTVGFFNTFGADVYEDLYGNGYDMDGDGISDVFVFENGDIIDASTGETVGKNAGSRPKGERGPDFSPEGMALTDTIRKLIEQGIIDSSAGEDPATSETVLQALREELQELLGSEGEGFFTDDELTAQGQLIQAQADEAATKLAQQMAMRGMGASGLAGAGFGGIAAQEFAELTDLAVQNKIAGDEARRANLAAVGQLLTGLQSDETRKELFQMGEEARRSDQAQTDMWNFMNNQLGLTQSDSWDAESQSAVMKAIESGVPYSEIVGNLTFITETGTDGNQYKKAYYNSPEGVPFDLSEEELAAGDSLDSDGSGDAVNFATAYEEADPQQKAALLDGFVQGGYRDKPPGYDSEEWAALGDTEKAEQWVSWFNSNGYEELARAIGLYALAGSFSGMNQGTTPNLG